MKDLKMTNNPHLRISEVWFHRFVTLSCMMLFLLSGVVFGADDSDRKVVRIPCVEFNRIMELDKDHNPVSGYAYEYMETIGIFAGWDIKYVPSNSFAESLSKLLAGEVDLLYDVSYTEERAKVILFPDEPMGFEYYYLYASKENTSIFSGDIDSIRGKTVGGTSSTMLIDLLKQWCTKKNVELKIVEYDSIPEKEADLFAGKIDLDLEISMLATNNLSAVEKIGSSAYYLVANKERPDLIEDINSAMEKIVNNDFSFFNRLQERYFSETVLSHNLTLEEKRWIADHKVLRVGFFDNYLPFSALDKNGNPTGACIEVVGEIIKKLNLENDLNVEFICYRDQRAGYQAVESGEVDLMLPAYISNSVKHDYRIMGGRILASLTSDLAFLEDFGDGRGKRIAVNRHNLMQYYNSRDSYPYAEVVFYDSIQGCLDGILDGTSDGTFLNGLRSEALLKPEKYHSLRKAQARTDYIFYMAFAEENLGLMLLMDRGLSMLDPAFVNKQAYSYIMQMNSFTLMDYLRDHILLVLLAVAVLVAGLITLIGYQISIRKLEMFNRELKERSDTIEKQRQQEAELRKQLEDALQTAQTANSEKTAVLADLENASEMARLASFHYDFSSRKRTGSNLVHELWPEDKNGNALLEEQWVYPEDLPIFKQNMNALFEKKGEANGTVQFSFRVGSPDNLSYYRMKLMLDPHNPNAVTGIVQDVTELALNILKLKDTQALWNAAINSIPIMFTVKDIDDDFRYLLCNKAFASVFHFSPDEIVGKTDHDIFHDDTTLGFADQINIPTTGTDGIMEIAGELPDGKGNLRYIKSILRVFEDARGHRLLLAAANDVTDMHTLFQNQRVVNQLLADIIGEDDFDLCIRRTLETVSKILGASRGTLMRHEDNNMVHCVFEYVDPTHPFANFKNLNRSFSRTGGFMGDTDDNREFICSDLRSIDWSKVSEGMHQAAIRFDLRAMFLSNILYKGKIWGTIGFNFEGIAHTFTENEITLLRATAHMIEVVLARKHAQTLIMDALDHAQAADKAKSFFIASVSHEIRTPLNSVIGFAELLREGGVSKNQEKEYLDAISSSANALLMLINDVLDLSKLEANQMQIVTAFTDFNALCREVLLIFTFRAQENANKLVSEVPDDLPELDVDNIRIRQILINLLGNAVKFTKNGSITLHVEFTPDPDSAGTGTLRCAVSDTGIGISEDDQKKLMEPFVQLSRMRGTNAVNNGTGLGLSISKRLATRMNGELTCTSRIGEGSTFEVTLNSVRYRAKAVKADMVQPKSKPEVLEATVRDVKTIRILIVDDVPMNLRVAKALFNKIGFNNVFIAGSGREALELLNKQPIDLILSDMWMPEMNGSQLSAEIKKNPKFSRIPIVAQTADVETSGNFDMSHFDAIILKPITKEKLSHMVKRIIVDGDLQKGDGGMPVNLG